MSLTPHPQYPLEKANLNEWVESNKQRLQPPVCNALIYNDQLKTMMVSGPNVRRDFHTNPTDEWFFQIKGTMVLTILDDGVIKHVPIREGEHYLLPPNTPHSPQRFANTIGLVMETERPNGLLDTLTYYCPKCNDINYSDTFVLTNLGQQLIPFITTYYNDESLRTCKKCGFLDEKPTIPVEIPDSVAVTPNGKLGINTPIPIKMQEWIEKPMKTDQQYTGQNLHVKKHGSGLICGDSGVDSTQECTEKGEKWVYCVVGQTKLTLLNGENKDEEKCEENFAENTKVVMLEKDEYFLVPPRMKHSIVTIGDESRAVSCTFDY